MHSTLAIALEGVDMTTVNLDRSYMVNDFLRSRGFILGDGTYAEDRYVPYCCYFNNPTLIARNGKTVTTHILDKLRGVKFRRFFIARLWIDNEPRKANKERFVLEVYGKNNIDRLLELANLLKQTFDVDVHVKLVGEAEQKELFWTDN